MKLCVVAALGFAVGCYNPSYETCAITCAANNEMCPSGTSCIQGVCQTREGECNPTGDGGGSNNDGWQYRKKITIGPTRNLQNFPVLVRTNDPDLRDFAQPFGADIKFETLTGTVLSHEIERFDKGLGELVAWVRMPMTRSIGNDEIYMYFGNAQARGSDPTSTWDPQYLAVYHMSDPTNAAQLMDATVNAKHAQRTAPASPNPTANGHIGGAQTFDGALAPTLGADTAFSMGTLTFEAWINVSPSTTVAQHRKLFSVPSSFPEAVGIGYSDPDSAAPSSTGRLQVAPSFQDNAALQSGGPVVALDTWVHVAVTLSPQSGTGVYRNGQMVSMITDPNGATVPLGNAVSIGGTADGSVLGVVGSLDEVRIQSAFRGMDYVEASYLIVANNSSLVTIGPREDL